MMSLIMRKKKRYLYNVKNVFSKNFPSKKKFRIIDDFNVLMIQY